LDTFGTC